MLHPIYSTVLGHPELIADHLANYSALVKDEFSKVGRGFINRIIAWSIAAVSAVLGLGFTGVAIMLGGIHGTFHWILVVVPGVTFLVTAISLYVAMRPVLLHAFDDVRAQLSADMHALHVAGGGRGN